LTRSVILQHFDLVWLLAASVVDAVSY
jgi:hypothetical protein